MKVDKNRLNEDPYMTMPFKTLVETVFFMGGDRKQCCRKARTALILRLEKHYGRTGFGSAETGQLFELEAYIAASMILIKKVNA